jgi:D-glycero-alpha-D-manno-heptose 1-phosphate guanylyltransferase
MSEAVTAVVLAGGLGTRLRSEVADRPKVLAPVAGRPFLEHLFSQIKQFGIQEVVLCVGYLAEMIQERYRDEYEGMAIRYSVERALLGTGGAIRFAADKITSTHALVLNGDSFCEFDYSNFLHFYRRNGAGAAMVLAHSKECGRYGAVQIDEHYRITSFVEKSASQGEGLINAGVYLFSTEMIKQIPVGRIFSLEKDIFPKWVAHGMYGFKTESTRFIDIGTPQSFKYAQSLFDGGENVCPK